MSKLRRQVPEEGDLVLCTINEITNHGAYVLLDEFENLIGFIHLSEIASRWIKNIRNFVRENQKVVTKVLRVNQSKKQIDLSIRRVTDQQKKMKIQQWKRAKNAEGLFKLAAEKIGKTLDEAYSEVGWKLEDKFGEIYFGLENVKIKGIKLLKELNISEDWIDVINEVTQSYVELSHVKLSATLTLISYGPEGVEAIKKALTSGLKVLEQDEEVKGRIYLIGSPKYSIEIEAPDYKTGETILSEIATTVINKIKKFDGEGSWERSK